MEGAFLFGCDCCLKSVYQLFVRVVKSFGAGDSGFGWWMLFEGRDCFWRCDTHLRGLGLGREGGHALNLWTRRGIPHSGEGREGEQTDWGEVK